MQPGTASEAASSQGESGPNAYKQLRLGLSRQYYAMASALGLKRVQDYFQGASPLLASAGPIWLLGEQYNLPSDDAELQSQAMSGILSDFTSRLWMTYRRGFPPLGHSDLTSDVGWGCTLRSGQMLLAQVLLQHIHGRQWRRPGEGPQQHTELAQMLSWFWDSPAPEHLFSIHALVSAGAPHGVVAGEWLGPWTLCHTLQAIVNKLHPSGLQVHLANTPGGGAAPVLYTHSALEAFEDRAGEQCDEMQRGLLVLVPLVLGIGQVSSVYIPQLQSVLRWPQSAGIVGGRPSSSLYFVGYQGAHILFLDPHQVQEVGTAPLDVAASYFCDTPRLMPITAIDPSLAIAFYCRSTESFQDLTDRLKGVEAEAKGAPLLNVVVGSPPPPFAERTSSLDEGGAARGDEQWELL